MKIEIREIRMKDNDSVKEVLVNVMKEFGVPDHGTALQDDELNFMYESYQESTSKYYVVISDGDIKRIAQKYSDFESLELIKVMKKNPISVNENTLATSALSLMNSKKITSLCVHKKNKMNKTIGLVHMHDILNSNIN